MEITIIIVLVVLIGFGILLNKRMKNKSIIEICHLFMQQRHKECFSKIEKFLKKHPKSDEVWLIRGNLGNEMFDNAMAKESFNKALEINPNYAKALAGLGVTYRREKKFNEAEDYYYKALKIDPELYLAKSSLMLLELYKNNFDVAIALGEDSIKNGITKVQPRIIENLMLVYHFSNKHKKRNELFTHLKEIEYSRLYALEQLFANNVTIKELMEE